MRLIDLRCNWLWQYAREITTFDHAHYQAIERRLGQVEGYLSGVSTAVLICNRTPEDWLGHPDPWNALDLLIHRYQAEFSGRLLMDAADSVRWRSEPRDALCWGLLGVGGFDALIRSEADLDHLSTLFHRGVRLFQPVDTGASQLGGSSSGGDDHGLTPLGKQFLERLQSLSPDPTPTNPRPILDLAHTNPRTFVEIVESFESNSTLRERVLLVKSDVITMGPEETSYWDTLRRFRALGGVVGLSLDEMSIPSGEHLASWISAIMDVPYRGEIGPLGIAIATNALGQDRNSKEFSSVLAIQQWFNRIFDKSTARRILDDNARALLLASIGATESGSVSSNA